MLLPPLAHHMERLLNGGRGWPFALLLSCLFAINFYPAAQVCLGAFLVGGAYILWVLPMMISAQCVQNTTLGCCKNKENDELILRDRYGKHFPMKRNCDECYNVIYNSVPLSLHTELTKLQKIKFNRYRLRFTIETPSEAMKIIQSFQNRLKKGNQDDLLTTLNYTKGHFKRGVE